MSSNIAKLNIHGKRGIMREFAIVIFGAILLFASAGTINWLRGWIYILVAFLYQAAYVLTLLIVNPKLLNKRGKLNWKKTKLHDRYFAVLYPIFGFAAIIVAGLDAVRYELSNISFNTVYPSILVFIFASFVLLWAYINNSHFILTHREDTAGKQQVCTTGPYRYIRHPAYFGGIIYLLCFPFLVGSWLSFVPILLNVALLIIRTYYEDKALKKELRSYEKYSKTTKYKLFPYIW